ncbi:MAG: hypothetical protein AAGK97_14355 [Bacteroidota bacterium]
MTEILKEMNTMINTPISSDDLTLVKNVMSGNFARSLESPQTVARFALNIARNGLPSDYYETYLTKLNAITTADIQMMAKKYLRPENAHYIIVGNKDEVADNLKAFGKVNYFDVYGNKLEIKDAPAVSADVTGESVVKDYLAAIGGMDKMKAVKTYVSNMVISSAMGNANMVMTKKAPNFMHMDVSVPGMGSVMEQKFNGVKLAMSGMGGSQEFTEGEMFESAIDQAKIFPELSYFDEGYSMELKGSENLDGTDCYKVVVTTPNGNKVTEYYDIESKMKTQVIVSAKGPDGQPTTSVNKFSDYKEVDGIMLPHKMETTGMGPGPSSITIEKYELNGDVDMSLFRIE